MYKYPADGTSSLGGTARRWCDLVLYQMVEPRGPDGKGRCCLKGVRDGASALFGLLVVFSE